MRKLKAARLAWSLTGLTAGLACIVGLIQGNAALSRGNVVILGILGTIFLFGGTIGLGWHKAPFPIGKVVKVCLLFAVCSGVMIVICIVEWPKSPEDIAAVVIKTIQEQRGTVKGKSPLYANPCRSDNLSRCTDEELYEWGSTVHDRIWEVEGKFVSTDELAKQQTKLPEKVAIYRTGEIQLASDFWDCCAADTLHYFEEVQLRVGGFHNDKTTDWLKDFAKHPMFGSKGFTDLDGMKSVLAALQLTVLQGQLKNKIETSKKISNNED